WEIPNRAVSLIDSHLHWPIDNLIYYVSSKLASRFGLGIERMRIVVAPDGNYVAIFPTVGETMEGLTDAAEFRLQADDGVSWNRYSLRPIVAKWGDKSWGLLSLLYNDALFGELSEGEREQLFWQAIFHGTLEEAAGTPTSDI